MRGFFLSIVTRDVVCHSRLGVVRDIVNQYHAWRGGVFEIDDVQGGQILAEAVAVAAGIDSGEAAEEQAIGGGVADDEHGFAGVLTDDLCDRGERSGEHG